MTCDDRHEQISAMLDGELPAAELAELTAHIAGCPGCARTLAELGGLRTALAHAVPDEAVSEDLMARIEQSLRQASPPPVSVRPWRSLRRRSPWLVAGAAIAAVFVLVLLPHHHDESLDLGGVRDAALRTAVTASPAAADTELNLAGFRLVGGRADVIAGHQARVLVYAQGPQRITLCTWSAGREPAHPVRQATYRGMAIRYWNDGKTEFWAASAGAPRDLATFVDAVMRRPS